MLNRFKWLGMVGVLCCVGAVAAEELDSSVWPSAGAGRMTRQAAVADTIQGPAGVVEWTVPLTTGGTIGGPVVSTDGNLYVRGYSDAQFMQIDMETGAVLNSYPVGPSYRSGPLVTETRVYVSTAGTGEITVYDRMDPNLPALATFTDGMIDTTIRSLQLGNTLAPTICRGDANCDGAINWRDIDFFVAAQNDNVSAWYALHMAVYGTPPTCPFENSDIGGPSGIDTPDGTVTWRDIDGFVALQNTTCPGARGGSPRLYTTRRSGDANTAYVQAWDSDTGTLHWELTIPHRGGLCQLGPLWMDGDKQMLAFCSGNGTPGIVHQIRDDGSSATIVSETDLNVNCVNGSGALSEDGSRIYYATPWDGGHAALQAISTVDGSIIWEVPQSLFPLSSYVASPAVVGNRVYIAGGSGNIGCVRDLGDTFAVAWWMNAGTTQEFTSISAAHNPVSGETFLYCSNQGEHSMYALMDMGAEAQIVAIKDFGSAQFWGGISTCVDGEGNVYQLTDSQIYKYGSGGDLPVAVAGEDVEAECGDSILLDASGSYDPDGTIVRYQWLDGATVLYDGPNATHMLEGAPCNWTATITLRVYDNDGFIASDTMEVSVLEYGFTQFEFIEVPADDGRAPIVGHWLANSLASDGTYLYFMKNDDGGGFYRTTDGSTWETLAAAPGNMGPLFWQSASSLTYDAGTGLLYSARHIEDTGTDWRDTVIVSYDATANMWTARGNRLFGGTGFVTANGYLFGSAHATDTNQGGSLTVADLSDIDAYNCYRTSVKDAMQGPDNAWFSRVVQHAYQPLNGLVYGMKNDWVVNPRGDGDRLFTFDPMDVLIPADENDPNGTVNLWGGSPTDPNCMGHQCWTTDKRMPATDLGLIPIEPGYGNDIVALPANWKTKYQSTDPVVGAEGGLFVVFGRSNANHEGWGGQNNMYGIYDIADAKWTLGVLPDWSGSGTTAAFHNGEVWIKQGCSNPNNPDWDPTNMFWVTDVTTEVILMPVADAGPDQPANPEDPPLTPGLVTMDGTASYATAPGATIAGYNWTLGGETIGTGPAPQVIVPAGTTSTVQLVVTDTYNRQSLPDYVDIRMDECAGSDYGYANDFDTIAGVSGPFPVYVQEVEGDNGVHMDIPDFNGYFGMTVQPVCPFDASGGSLSVTIRATGANLPAENCWWIRAYTANNGYRGWLVCTPTDGLWTTIDKCVDLYDDPTTEDPPFTGDEVEYFVMQPVNWSGGAATVGAAYVEWVPTDQFPLAVADGFLVDPGNIQCPGTNEVWLDGSGSCLEDPNHPGDPNYCLPGGNFTYEWSRLGEVIATGETAQVFLPVGPHFITLTVTDVANDCAFDSDTIFINIPGSETLPLDDPMNFDNGAIIRVPENYPIEIGTTEDFADITIGFHFAAVADPAMTTATHGALYENQGASGWYHGPWYDLGNACYGAIDVTSPSMKLQFEGRYYQDASNWDAYVFADPNDPNADPLQPYEDAPIFVTFRDANGKRGSLGILYGPDHPDQLGADPNDPADDPYPPGTVPPFKSIDVYVSDQLAAHAGETWMTDPDFDPTQVVRIEFWGTDWGGLGSDLVSVRNLLIGEVTPYRGACCLDGAVCEYHTQADCTAAGGTYMGDNVLCEDVICP